MAFLLLHNYTDFIKNYDENYQFRKEIESKGYSQQEFVNTVRCLSLKKISLLAFL